MSENTEKKASPISRTIRSEAFIEKFFLLILTALLSGLLIPVVTTDIQRRKTRNDIITQAQTNLQYDVSSTLMTMETLLLDISWYKTKEGYNEEMHKKAFDRYAEKSIDLLSQLRVESIKAKTLASKVVSDRLDSFHLKIIREQIDKMHVLYGKNTSVDEWRNMHDTTKKIYNDARKLIFDLAVEMKLTKDNIE